MSQSRRAPRRRSRQVALQVLYAIDVAATSRSGTVLATEEAFEAVAKNFELQEGVQAFAKDLVNGIVEYGAELDALLSAHTTNWRLSRMAVVDRNTLRIGAYELTHTDTPARIVLDEAIELARRFGDDPSPAFVNGVLDSFAAAVRRGDEPGTAVPEPPG